METTHDFTGMTDAGGNLPVAVIGAGPVGLAAAAHLTEQNRPFVVLEAGPEVAMSFADVSHVRLFSPWKFNVDGAAGRLLGAKGWSMPEPEGLPTAGEVRRKYLVPLADLFGERVRFNQRVKSISRLGFDKVKTNGRQAAPFVLDIVSADGPRQILASAVIDASGTWGTPNPLGSNGLPAPGELELKDRIEFGMPDVLGSQRSRYAGKRVLVVGAGHSALGTLLSLARLSDEYPDTSIIWATRGASARRLFGGGDKDGLAERGKLGSNLRALVDAGRFELHAEFFIQAIVTERGRIVVHGRSPSGEVSSIRDIDRIVAATGSRPELSMTRELRLRTDPMLESTETLAPLIDPNVHSCGSVPPHGHRELSHPETGFYSVGAKSYGRAPNFLLATGYEQVRSVVAALAGDLEAADDVQLVLPETGVCSSDPSEGDGQIAPSAGCCAPKPKASSGRVR
jgi:thioredoxin reductase